MRYSLNRKPARGFTLAELLLAVTIAIIALCGILATYITCFNLMSTSKNTSIAASVAQGIMERIRATPFPQIATTASWPEPPNVLPAHKSVVYIDNTNPEFLRITVCVSWSQGLRVIGEDKNLNGLINAGEDVNLNNILDSPVEIVSFLANR